MTEGDIGKNKEGFLFEGKRCPQIFKAVDDIIQEVNVKLKMRGVGKGMICIWEDVNICCNQLQKKISKAYNEKDYTTKQMYLVECDSIMKDLWISLRQLYKSKALTAGELNNLFVFSNNVNDQLQKWLNSVTKAMNG